MNTPLRNAREKLGQTTRQLSSAIGMSQSQYVRVENAIRRPSPSLADKIAKYFGNAVTRDQILFPQDYAEPAPAPKPRLRKAS